MNDCASSLLLQDPALKRKSAIFDMIQMQGSSICEMFVLIFSTKENVNGVLIVGLPTALLRKEMHLQGPNLMGKTGETLLRMLLCRC